MRPIVTDVADVRGLPVCVLVTAALQKRTNRSKCRLGVDSLGLSNYMHVLDGGPDPQAKGHFSETYMGMTAVDILNVNRQGAARGVAS